MEHITTPQVQSRFEDDLLDLIEHDEKIDVKVSGKKVAKEVQVFEDPQLNLNQQILRNINDIGYKIPTVVQKHAMPQMMAHLDLMCCSCTGSGKTAAYLLAVINLIQQGFGKMEKSEKPCPKALILSPTRELAEQICMDAKQYSKGLGLNTVAIFGGDLIGREKRELKKSKLDILVATPGRLLHFLTDDELSKYLSLNQTSILIIDEADEMFNRSFFPDINEIVSHMKPKEERVTVMFSATFPNQIQYYAKKHLREGFAFVVAGIIGGASPDVIQEFLPVAESEKRVKLLELLDDEPDKKFLVFCNTRDKVDFVTNYLRLKKLNVSSIHGEMEQYERDQAINDFNTGRSQILVATSVASRGLNISNVARVINFDVSDNVDDYIQRIGRVRTVDDEFGVAKSFYNEDTDSEVLPELLFALKSTHQPVPEFMLQAMDDKQQMEKELQSECLDEDVLMKMKKFKINSVDVFEDEEWF